MGSTRTIWNTRFRNEHLDYKVAPVWRRWRGVTQEQQQRQRYERYYRAAGSDRNGLLTNAGTRFQVLALEFSIMSALSLIDLDSSTATLLDVGCGSAAGFYHYLRLGLRQANMTGIEVRSSHVTEARAAYPNANIVHGDASAMEFEDSAFDVVAESTMFATLTADDQRDKIAREMLRVCRPGGYIVLVDWRTPRPGKKDYKALTRRDVQRMFSVGCATELVARVHGALIPPLGRLLSRHAWPLYFLVAALAPGLVGQVVYLLKKTRSEKTAVLSLDQSSSKSPQAAF
jgi:SAM-dependent methyltransferase